MERKEYWMLIGIGALLSISSVSYLIPILAFIPAYLLVRYFDLTSGKIALLLFLMSVLLFSGVGFLESQSVILIGLGGLILIALLVLLMILIGILICLIGILNKLIDMRGKQTLVGILLSPIVGFSLWLSSINLLLWAIPTVILLVIILSSAASYFYRKNKLSKSFYKGTTKKNTLKKREEDFGLFFMYILGGIFLTFSVYWMGEVEEPLELISIAGLSVWATTLTALSSKHKLSDIGYVLFVIILLPFFVPPLIINGGDLFFIISSTIGVESTFGVYRIIIGFAFTLLLLGYDIRRVPLEGLIEYSIYGLSFLPLILLLILVAVNTISTYLAMIFALLVLFKIIFTAGYVYKRIGIE